VIVQHRREHLRLADYSHRAAQTRTSRFRGGGVWGSRIVRAAKPTRGTPAFGGWGGVGWGGEGTSARPASKLKTNVSFHSGFSVLEITWGRSPMSTEAPSSWMEHGCAAPRGYSLERRAAPRPWGVLRAR
jgi:hypothetical protein